VRTNNAQTIDIKVSKIMQWARVRGNGALYGRSRNSIALRLALSCEKTSNLAACRILLNIGNVIIYSCSQFITPHDILFEGVDKTFGFCTTVPNPLLTTYQSLFMEFFCTFFLLCMVCGAFDPRSNSQVDTLPLKFAFAIVGITLTAVSI
jgi:hypothetical protein